MKKIAIACDRAGIELKNFLIQEMKEHVHFIDLGVNNDDPVDYPDYAKKVVENILKNTADYGVLICGTGIGMSIAANRYKGIRASLCHSGLEARLTREHNDANVLCMGARIIGKESALENLKIFINTEFSGDDRHIRRIKKIESV
jgi:ribose 5-phosphate isomerase B